MRCLLFLLNDSMEDRDCSRVVRHHRFRTSCFVPNMAIYHLFQVDVELIVLRWKVEVPPKDGGNSGGWMNKHPKRNSVSHQGEGETMTLMSSVIASEAVTFTHFLISISSHVKEGILAVNPITESWPRTVMMRLYPSTRYRSGEVMAVETSSRRRRH